MSFVRSPRRFRVVFCLGLLASAVLFLTALTLNAAIPTPTCTYGCREVGPLYSTGFYYFSAGKGYHYDEQVVAWAYKLAPANLYNLDGLAWVERTEVINFAVVCNNYFPGEAAVLSGGTETGPGADYQMFTECDP